MGTEQETLHIRGDDLGGESRCVCGALWIPAGESAGHLDCRSGGPKDGPGRCWNEGTMLGDVWELKQMVADLKRRVIAIAMVVKRGSQ